MATVTSTLPDKPLFMQAATGDALIPYTAEAYRRLVGSNWFRTGVITNDAFLPVQRAAGANYSVDISPGYAVLGLTSGEYDRYLAYSGLAINVPLTGFNTNPVATRTHKIWLAIYDKQKYNLGTLYEAQIIITEDTGSGAPTPASPVTHLNQLASFTLTTGQANIQNVHITPTIRHASSGSDYAAIPLGPSIVSGDATMDIGVPRALRHGTTAKLTGGFRRSSLADFAANTAYVLGTVSASFRPTATRYLNAPCAISSTSVMTYRLTIAPTGVMTAVTPVGWTPSYLAIDGCHYELD
jgi:hypothetical protein